MDKTSIQLSQEIVDAAARSLSERRPLLHHLNADTSWLLQIPRPATDSSSRAWYNILIDPWLTGSQSDVASWFSQQWHAETPKVGSIAAVNELAYQIEKLSASLHHGKNSEANGASATSDENTGTLLDCVALSHEFTDHCHKETLLQVDRSTPVFATKKAADLVKSWKHFDVVVEVPPFPGKSLDWRDTIVSPLPPWLTIARVVSAKDALYYHSALLVVFEPTAPKDSSKGEAPSEEANVAEAVIYTPHGIVSNDLKAISTANPPITTLAFLHGLHDVAIGSQKQLNLGAHNGLQAQRVLQAPYWIGTHDEVKKGGGLISWFLKRKVITLQEALEQERQRAVSEDGSDAVVDKKMLDDTRFVELRNGASAVLA